MVEIDWGRHPKPNRLVLSTQKCFMINDKILHRYATDMHVKIITNDAKKDRTIIYLSSILSITQLPTVPLLG